MSRTAWLAGLMMALAAPVHAQNGQQQFITPDTARDAAQASQQQAFLVLRDSTTSIGAAGAKLMGGMGPSSTLPWMQARAREVAAACARSVGPLGNARSVTEHGDQAKTSQTKAEAALLKEMTAFSVVLADCQKRWSALAADTSQVAVRDTAPHLLKSLEDNLDKFDRTVRTYLRSIDVTLPYGGTPAR